MSGLGTSPDSPPNHEESSVRPSHGLHVILFEPEIASNTGAIGRTCVAVGATLWLVRPLGFHIDDRSLRRAGMDYWRLLDVRVVDRLTDATEALGTGRIWSFTSKADRLYTGVAFSPGDALLFGSESRGLPKSWLSQSTDRAIRIPIRPQIRCLNLANAVAVGLYEAVRQVGGL